MRKIIQMGNPILETPAENVKNPMSSEVTKIIEDLFETIESRLDHAAGLAAPQIGYGKRITVLRRFDIEEANPKSKEMIWEVVINPEITYRSEELSTEWEGCLSIKDGDLFGKVARPVEVEVKFLDINGEEKVVRVRDYQSHVFQHEIDHLDGKLFLRYVENPQELYTAAELKKKNREEVNDL